MERRRAFIAAPLLGTIIFLIAVVFVVNLSKTEAQQVERLSDDAYHNRVVSLLELYRSDLLGLFTDGLRQNAEDFLAGYNWIGVNDIKEFSAGERQRKCDTIKGVIQTQLQSSGASGNNYLNGLSDLLNALRSSYTFEGLTFKPVTFTAQTPSYGPVPWNFVCNDPVGNKVCKALLPYDAFDCNNFATNLASPYQCCAVDPKGGQCPAGKVLRGCEEGTFDLQVDISNPDIYAVMPRIQVSDSVGNTIRASALGSITFMLPVRFPIFRYNDASFRLFAFQQYFSGAPAKQSTAQSDRGQLPSWSKGSFRSGMGAACSYFNNDPKFKTFDFAVDYFSTTNLVTCKAGSKSDQIDSSSAFKDTLRELLDSAKIIDQDPRFRVNKDSPNVYNVHHEMTYPLPT